ncbi:MAG: ATP-binding protein [Candidatus Eisenbacteria bacterium]
METNVLSIPVIKDFIKSRHTRRQGPDLGEGFFHGPGGTPIADTTSYLLHLAKHLDLDLLALIELDPEGKSARLTAAGNGGVTCELTIPSFENGGMISRLVTEARPASGSGKVFTRDEVFPCGETWCDLIPMDSSVPYFFVPWSTLPAPPENPRISNETAKRRFVLVTSDTGPGEDANLALKALACAGLISCEAAGPEAGGVSQSTETLGGFLLREGYSFCTVTHDGIVSDTTGGIFEKYDSDSLMSLMRKIEALSDPKASGSGGPHDITPESIQDTRILAHTIASSDGRGRRVILRTGGIAPTREAHQDRFTMLSRFMSSIAHEIKNPLTGIAAGVQYLSKKLESGSTEDETVEFVLTEINRLNRIVDDLYRIAKPPELVLAKTSANVTVGKSLLCLSEEILRKRLSVEQDLDKDIPEFDADADRLQQVLINIIKNAVEVSSENATVRIKTARQGPNVVIRVSDSGTGIAEADAERIFEPFYSTKKGGTGLGLCICQRIVDQHGGRILIETSRDGGTTFIIELPLKE